MKAKNISIIIRTIIQAFFNRRTRIEAWLIRAKVKCGLKKLIFFCATHNGDIHYSREFVKDIARIIKAEEYVYAHYNSPKVLKDFKGISYNSLYSLHDVPVHLRYGCNRVEEAFIYKRNERILYINTWLGQQFRRFLLPYNGQLTLEGNYRMYSELLRFFGFQEKLNSDKSAYIPTIDYDAYGIDKIKKFFSAREKRIKVFITNSRVNSAQLKNFDFSPICVDLANCFPDADFFLTNKNEFTMNAKENKNIFFNEDIINTSEGDLNENSYLSLYCDIIVGRESGAFCFCIVKENLFNPDKTLICFSNNQIGAFWYGGNIEARRVWSNKDEPSEVAGIISHEIAEKQKLIR